MERDSVQLINRIFGKDDGFCHSLKVWVKTLVKI